jgi:ABC-type cobalamin/Fe3+-siderophores transport system ATPase subunit
MADKLQSLGGSQLRLLDEIDRPDAIHVEVDLADTGEQRWTHLREVSPGQAATAMLALALVAGSEPLVIDQPEDDLDNRFIYEEIVQQIADVASQRQVIVATHNANIPVLGDAELVVAFEATTERGEILARGGLDEPVVATTARNILEGGVEAFEARARRYG